METRLLGKTELRLRALSFGASSLGQESRSVKLDDALESVRVALDAGLSFIDTSPFPALRQLRQAGKVRFLGFSGSPQKIIRFICDQVDVDCVLRYNQCTLQNTRFADETIPYLKAKGIGVMNAGPFSAWLLTNAPLPAWMKEPENVKSAARAAAAHRVNRGVDAAKLALLFSLAKSDIATTITGSANPANIRQWASWAGEPIKEQLLAEVLEIFKPVKNPGHAAGLPENN